MTITVIGGGLAGLVAAIECAEAGEGVRVFEAQGRLGGRAATAPGGYQANLGPHAFYTGPFWSWLAARRLHRPHHRPLIGDIRFRWHGEITRVPPRALRRAYRLRRVEAPVDLSLREWLDEQGDEEMAAAVGGLAGPLTFDADPGRLSAAFVWERVTRILFAAPPVARYAVGGWAAVVERMADHAQQAGVRIETAAKVESLGDVDDGPVILAVGPRAARTLTGDATLHVESPRVALLDLGIDRRRGDPYIVSDLDEAAFVDRFTKVVPSLAPRGQSLVQASVGQRVDEPLDRAVARIEAILDETFAGWRDRERWRRRSSVTEATGALDLPGRTWRDRPAIVRPDGTLLCGDWVAAPGHLCEVSWASAVEAARSAVASERTRRDRIRGMTIR
jgi:phytoene dehydrogenase-like protein